MMPTTLLRECPSHNAATCPDRCLATVNPCSFLPTNRYFVIFLLNPLLSLRYPVINPDITQCG